MPFGRNEKTQAVEELLSLDGAQLVAQKATAFSKTNPAIGVADAQVLAANPYRRYLLIQNNDAANAVYVNFGVAADVNGVKLNPGDKLELSACVPSDAIHAIGAAATTAVVVVEA